MKIIERKGDTTRNEQCLFFPQCFPLYHIDKLPAILRSSEIVDCKLFLFERKIFAWQWLIVRIIRDQTKPLNYYMVWTIDDRTIEILLCLIFSLYSKINFILSRQALPRWLSVEHFGLMTWWLRVWDLVEDKFLSSVFCLSPLLKHVRKVVSGFGKKIVYEKAGKH